jgi:hypothetical protein
MSIKIRLYYFKNGGAGHIALRVTEIPNEGGGSRM